MLQFDCKCQTTPRSPRARFFSWQQVTFSLSRKGTSLQHDRFYRVVLSRYWSFAVIVDFVCVFRSIWPQAYRSVCLMQETSNSTFSSTNALFDQTVRVWIVGASCAVKGSVFSQPAIHCAHKLSSFIAVETPNSTEQQLHVYHRFFDRLTALVCQRLDETKACFSAQCNQQTL